MTKPKPRELIIKGHKVLVDEDDYPIVSRFTWHIKMDKLTHYACTNIRIKGKQTSISMHRLIMAFPTGEVDHKNRNGLDNRKENLRYCTKKQNQYNRVRFNKYGYRGVYKPSGTRYFAFQIQAGNKRKAGYGYKTPEDAARAYDEANKELHGEFGIRNFKD